MESVLSHLVDNDRMDCNLEMDVEPSNGEVEEMPVSSIAEEFTSFQEGRGGDGSLDPYEGMEFETEEEAWTFYNAYARRVGFNTRISVFHRSRRDRSITSRQFVCAKEGFRSNRAKKDIDDGGKVRRTRAVTRVGCKAMIRVKKQGNGKWVVSKFQKVHNHALVAPSRVHCLRSLRLLSESAKNSAAFREESREANNRSYSGITQEIIVQGETQSIRDYFKRMQDEDPGFFYAMQFDGDQCATGNVFWADARSRTAYKHFGDVVTFDMTYKTNHYQIPFVYFTGVNHHRQPVLFGGAILVDNSEASVVWLFKMLLSAMSGCHPTSIVSEQDWIIQEAVARVFPQTRHRLCKWHILKEGQEKLSHVYRAFPSFQGEFTKCINMAEKIDEFESCWESLITRFNLGDNEWLLSLYSCRHQWVPVYLRSIFSGEMSSIQRCESKSSFFEGYINAQIDPHTFVHRYEKALDSRYEKEVKADFDTIYTLPVLKTSSPLEKQAADIYTRKIFRKFQEELVETVSYTANKVNEECVISTYRVAKFEEEEHKTYTVVLNASETKATCSCQMFEYLGILCRHILTVFSVTGVVALPSCYTLKRWTRNAKNEGEYETNNGVVLDEAKVEPQSNNSLSSRGFLTWRYNSLCREAIKYAEDGATSIDIYNVAMDALQEAVRKVNMAKKGQHGDLPDGTNQEEIGSEGIQTSKEKELQDTKISEEISGMSSKEVRPAINLQCLNETRQAVTPQEVWLLQQPFNFVLVAPDLLSESGSPIPLMSAAPSALNTPNGQALCTLSDNSQLICCTQGMSVPVPLTFEKKMFPSEISAGGLGGEGPVLVRVPTVSIPKGDPKHGRTPSQPSQGLDLAGIGRAMDDPGSGSDATSSGSSDSQQLVAVPMAFYVPVKGNLPAACSVVQHVRATSMQNDLVDNDDMRALATNSSTPYQPRQAPHLAAAAAAAKPQQSTNPIHVAAIAAGARIASPEAAASLMKAVQSKNAIHIRARESSSPLLKPLAPKPLGSSPTTIRYLPVDLDASAAYAPHDCNQLIQSISGGLAPLVEAQRMDGPIATCKEPEEDRTATGWADAEDQSLEGRGDRVYGLGG